MRYAIVDRGVVVNVVEWDGDPATWSPPAGTIAVPDTSIKAHVDGTFDGKIFKPPVPIESIFVDKIAELEARLSALEATLTPISKP